MWTCNGRPASSLQALALCLSVWLAAFGPQCRGDLGAADYGNTRACDIDPLVRPVIIVHGFRGSFLYNSSANYMIEWVDFEDVAPGNEGRGVGDLDLPLTWDSDLTQDMTDVGPESFDGDDTPSLFLANGTLIPIVAPIFSDLVSIVKEWEASSAAGGKRLLYSVAHDWRRDMWEQSERVVQVVDQVLEETGCKPIIAAHSFGGVVTYSGFARFGKAFADKVHGVFYGACPFQTFISSVESPGTAAVQHVITRLRPLHAILDCLHQSFHHASINIACSSAFSQGSQADLGPSGAPETQFTWPSLFSLIPSAAGTCADSEPLFPPSSPTAPPPQPCDPGDLRTGITCNSTACGRPADWPAGEPFFLSVDFHDPLTWQLFGLGLPTARVLQGLTGADVLYSEEELTHLAFALQTSARLAQFAVGTPDGDLSGPAAVAAIHPPVVQLSLHLTDIEVPGQGTRDFQFATSLECVPAPTFGELGAAQCANFLPAVIRPSDGLLTSDSTVFKHPELFGPKLQVINTTVPAPLWLQLASADPELGFGPHGTVFQGRTTAQGAFVDCGEFPARIDFDTTAGQYPALEALICSLVRQGQVEAGAYGEA